MRDIKTGILFAVPGTTCPEAAVAFENIDRAVASRFPGVARRWGYTSAGVRRKVAGQGCRLDDPGEALALMRKDGVTRTAVLPLHLSDGMEYGELSEAVAEARRARGEREQITLGHPLLTSSEDIRRAAEAVLGETAAAGRGSAAVILVAHGSRQARGTFRSAAALFRRSDPRLFLGSMLCPPAADDVLSDCLAAGVRQAWLVPCMVAAGFSAREDIAGAGAGSWKSVLERGGVECVPLIKGLGEFAGVVSVWTDQADRLLADLEVACR